VEERRLKKFMYQRLYYHPEQIATAEKARDVVARLFAAYQQDPATMPDAWRSTLPASEPEKSRHIADFIAGMTDRFAIDQCRKLYGRAPEGLSNV
jgi:dGTPase